MMSAVASGGDARGGGGRARRFAGGLMCSLGGSWVKCGGELL